MPYKKIYFNGNGEVIILASCLIKNYIGVI